MNNNDEEKKIVKKGLSISAEKENFDDSFIDSIVDEQVAGMPPSKLESHEQVKKRLKAQYKNTLGQYQECFFNAAMQLEKSGFEPESSSQEAIRSNLENIADHAEDLITGDVTLQNLLMLTNEDLIHIYEIGLQFYTQKDYVNARDIFLLLTSINSTISQFWTALGLTEKELTHYDVAAMVFTFAAVQNPEDLSICLHAADCLRLQNRTSEAIQMLDAMIEAAEDEPDWQDIKKQAEEFKSEWQKAA